MLKLKNKKGEISIIVLVVLTLMIVSATLFTFIQNSEGAQTKIYNAEFVQGFYLKQEYAEFYLKQAGENAIAKAYMEVVNSEKYLKSPVKYDPNKNVWFNSLNENLEKLFIEQFKENFREEIGNYDFKEEYLKDLKNQISEENFKIDYSKENPEVLRLVLNGLELKGSFEEMNITGSSGIFLNFDFRKIGLHSFKEIYEAKEFCRDIVNKKECFEIKLVNFEADVSESEDKNSFIVALTSKKEFLIEGVFQKISLKFIFN